MQLTIEIEILLQLYDDAIFFYLFIKNYLQSIKHSKMS